jgi:hypothetical protein
MQLKCFFELKFKIKILLIRKRHLLEYDKKKFFELYILER